MSEVRQLEPSDPRREPRRRDDAEKQSAPDLHRGLELVIAIALGLAAIVGAFAAYRNEQENHHASTHFSEGIANFDESGQLFASANSTLSRDQAQFLAYVTAVHDRKPELARFVRAHLMDARLQAAVAWWQSRANTNQAQPAPTPFVAGDRNYRIPEQAQALQRTADSERRFEQAKVDQGKADHYELIEVILATALFMYGIAGVTRGMTVKLATLATGALIFVLAVALLMFG